MSVDVVDATTGIVMAAKSSSGTCYAIGDSANGPGTVFANLGNVPAASRRPRRPLPTAVSAPTIANATSGGGWAQAW